MPRSRTTAPVLALLGALASLATLGGCSLGAVDPGGRTFLSTVVTDGGAVRPLVAGTRIRLDFREGNLGASAGCNSIGGAYRIDGGRLIVDEMGMTEMGCDPDRDAQDRWLVAFLGARPSIRLAGDELSLQGGSVVIVLRDREIVEPDQPIVGARWVVETIIIGDAAINPPAGATASLTFSADGTFSVETGCNQGSGGWRAVSGGLELSEIGLTKRACDGPGGELEAAVLAVLNAGTIGASIDADRLTLQAAGHGLVLRAS